MDSSKVPQKQNTATGNTQHEEKKTDLPNEKKTALLQVG